jgi:hypothetical protein
LRLAASVARYASRGVVLSQMAAGNPKGLACKRIGAPLLFGRLWQETGCQAVIENLLAGRAFEFPVARAVFGTTAWPGRRFRGAGLFKAGEGGSAWIRDGRAMPATCISRGTQPLVSVRTSQPLPAFSLVACCSRSRSRSTSPHSGRTPAWRQRSSSSLQRRAQPSGQQSRAVQIGLKGGEQEDLIAQAGAGSQQEAKAPPAAS